MLVLGSFKSWEKWEAAGIRLYLSPLTADERMAIAEECSGIADGHKRITHYQVAVGLKTIHAWEGVGGFGADGKFVEVPCEPERIAEFMSIPDAADFVSAKVNGIAMRRWQMVEAAGNASSGASAGTATADPKP